MVCRLRRMYQADGVIAPVATGSPADSVLRRLSIRKSQAVRPGFFMNGDRLPARDPGLLFRVVSAGPSARCKARKGQG